MPITIPRNREISGNDFFHDVLRFVEDDEASAHSRRRWRRSRTSVQRRPFASPDRTRVPGDGASAMRGQMGDASMLRGLAKSQVPRVTAGESRLSGAPGSFTAGTCRRPGGPLQHSARHRRDGLTAPGFAELLHVFSPRSLRKVHHHDAQAGMLFEDSSG